MPKPNQNFTVKEMKDYIRQKKLNHPEIKLSMKRNDLIKGLKSAGHWDEKDKVKKVKKPSVKPSGAKKEYTITTNPDTFNRFDKDFYVDGDPFITYLGENDWELQMNTRMGQGARYTKTLTKTQYNTFIKRFSKMFKSNQYSISK